MKFFKPYIKPLIIFFISLFAIPLILTIQNLFNIETSRIEIIIITSILMLILGIILGRKVNSKGYLNGLLLSTISILFIVILSLIFKYTLNINSLIYYIILLFSTVFGSMIGISLKQKK